MTYFALTIGPIYETMKKARKTRDLWAASYMLSYLIRSITENITAKIGAENLIMPHVGENPKSGAGLYPDRIIALLPEGITGKELNDVARNTIEQFAEKVADHLTLDVNKIYNYFESYIRYVTTEITIQDGANIFETIYPVLDQLELCPKMPLPGSDFVADFINNINGSFLVEDGFGSENIRFESILEVSAKTLEFKKDKIFNEIIEKFYLASRKIEALKKLGKPIPEELKKLDETNLVKDLKEHPELKPYYRPHQKYIAIVYADGDKVGKTIEKIATEIGEIKRFSEFLYGFSKEATDQVLGYGGMPVYMGGDDMLFFAPVAVENSKGFETIFDLCKYLDVLFENHYATLKNDLKIDVAQPSLSFGIAVTYYKYPLYEGLLMAHDNLKDKAKNEKRHAEKNTIALSIQKHSGQLIEAEFEKDSSVFKSLNNFINKYVAANFDKGTEFLNSLTHKLESYAPLFDAAAENNIELYEFFKNNFDEDIHLNKKEIFLQDLAKVTNEIFYSGNTENRKLLYAALRFIHFINTKEDDR